MTLHITALPPQVVKRLVADRELMRALCAAIGERIERDIAILDALDGDTELEADYTTTHHSPAGVFLLGRSTDDEPSLCGVTVSWPGWPVNGHNCSRDLEDIELVTSDDEDGGDIEPSLCGTAVSWPSTGGDDREYGDDNGIGDAGGAAEQYSNVYFGSAQELDQVTGEPLVWKDGKLVAERWA